MELTNQNKDRKQRRQNLDVSIYGKIPPQAKDLEEAILGAIMLERDAYDQVAEILRPEMFYVESHQRIYGAMGGLVQKSQPIDIHTVTEQLRSTDDLEVCGGPYYVTKLTNSVVSAANLVAHSRIILQKFVQRELIRIGGELVNNAFEDTIDPFQLLDDAQESFSVIGESLEFGEMTHISAVLIQALKKIEDWRQQDSHITGVPSGYKDIDNCTRGWQNGDLIILAARPSVGKTALALNLLRNAATFLRDNGSQKSVAVWSLEMKSVMLILRMLSAESNVWLSKIQTGRLDKATMDKQVFQKGIRPLADLPIYLDDTTGLTMQKLKSKARKLKRKNKLSLIIVDYLQLMTPQEKSGNREQEISKISRGLKTLAMELDIPIIALSQLSREVEKRTGAGKKPQLSDLRESGSIEQDADVVAFLWAPDENEILQDASLINRRYFRIAKQRNGMLTTAELDFKDEIQLFSSIQAEFPGMPGGNWRAVDGSEFDKPLL